MDTTTIEAMIEGITGDPHAAKDLHDLLAAVAERNDVTPGDPELARAASFVIAYMEQVPYMLKVATTAARTVGLDAEMSQVVEMVQSYWEDDEDVIPDHLGIIGLLDDAYCSLTTLQNFSDHYQLQTGKHMFPEDLTAANRYMRRIIGDPYVDELDRFVNRAIRESGVMTAVKALASEDKQRHLAANANIWNHGPAGEMSVAGLRGIGVRETQD